MLLRYPDDRLRAAPIRAPTDTLMLAATNDTFDRLRTATVTGAPVLSPRR
ncbi:MAG: hypothetical protein IT356_01500 [Gemmatimonadaceae bacterium]|nr:hypothetical protein [Gemmatimonadaceae bacterium]